MLTLLVAATPFCALPALADPGRDAALDALKAQGQWDDYEEQIRATLADATLPDLDRARLQVRLASMLHAVRQDGYTETVDLLAAAQPVLAAAPAERALHAESHAQRAVALLRLQRFPEALAEAEQGAAIARTALDAADLPLADRLLLYNALNLQASAYLMTGDERRARPIFEDLVTRFEAEAPDHPRLGVIYVNYGAILYNFGRYRELAAIMAKADRIFAPIPNPIAKAAVKANWGLALSKQGRWAEAEPLLAAGIAQFEEIGATQSPIFANAIQDWGIVAGQLGDVDDALERIDRALALREQLYGPDNYEVAVTLAHRARVHQLIGDAATGLADSTRAAAIIADLPDPDDHLDLQLIVLDHHLRLLAATHAPAADRAAVFDRYQRALVAFTRRQLSYGHEGERLAFLQLHDPVSAAMATGDPERVGETLLRFRGLVSDALIEDVQLAASADADDLAAWRAALQSESTDTATLAALESRLASHAAQLGAPRRALTLDLAGLRAHLQPGDALQTYFLYRPWLTGPDAPEHYGVWSLTATGQPTLRDLGPREDLDTRVADFLAGIRAGRYESTLRLLLQSDDPATERVFVVPEGILHQVPFAVLPHPDEGFWAEHVTVLNLTSPRDLIPAAVRESAVASPALTALGAPDFGESTWTALPAAEPEVAALTSAASAAGWAHRTFTGPAATEARLRDLGTTTHLHLATHGFALTTAPDAEPAERLAATGLVLAHPRSDAWMDGRTTLPVDPTDGVLTALEIMPLDLRGVQLVTLAACTSAQGSMAPNEGLYGLPQAFRRAGAGSVVAALWPVEDEAARVWMTDFYRGLSTGQSIDRAFAATQAARLRAVAETDGAAAAARQAGPWILSYRAPHAD